MMRKTWTVSGKKLELQTNRFDVFRIENVDDDLPAQILLHDGSVCLPHRLQGLVILEPLEWTEWAVRKKSADDRILFGSWDLGERPGGKKSLI